MENNIPQEEAMRESFFQISGDIILNSGRYRKEKDIVKVGFEFEYILVDGNLDLIGNELKVNILKQLNDEFKGDTDPILIKEELGASQLEAAIGPFLIDKVGTFGLEDRAYDMECAIIRRAKDNGANALRTGFYPRLNLVDELIERSDKIKYRTVPSFHDIRRGSHIDTRLGNIEIVDVSPAASIGLANSVQFNIQCSGIEDAIQKNNISLMIAPFLLALGGNSRFINYKDTGYSDVRMPVWEKSHDIRSPEEIENCEPYRIGLPKDYYKDIMDYFNDVASFPFILGPEQDIPLKAALEVGIGLYWRDSRIKFPQDDACVVEFRILPMQPKLEQDFGLFFYYLGRVVYAQRQSENLLDMQYVEYNRNSVMAHGLDGTVYYLTDSGVNLVSTKDAIREDLKRAETGLSILGIHNHIVHESYFEPLYKAINYGCPSRVFASKFYKDINKGLDKSDALDNQLRKSLL